MWLLSEMCTDSGDPITVEHLYSGHHEILSFIEGWSLQEIVEYLHQQGKKIIVCTIFISHLKYQIRNVWILSLGAKILQSPV